MYKHNRNIKALLASVVLLIVIIINFNISSEHDVNVTFKVNLDNKNDIKNYWKKIDELIINNNFIIKKIKKISDNDSVILYRVPMGDLLVYRLYINDAIHIKNINNLSKKVSLFIDDYLNNRLFPSSNKKLSVVLNDVKVLKNEGYIYIIKVIIISFLLVSVLFINYE